MMMNRKSDHARGTRSDFASAVFRVVAGIAAGSAMSYKGVAAAAGRPRAWRAVGNILNSNYDTRIPCHRVIRSDGRPGGYNRGRRRKVKLLRAEGAVSRGQAKIAGRSRRSA
jgi:O-6-methylguanine DNA methyltransferase